MRKPFVVIHALTRTLHWTEVILKTKSDKPAILPKFWLLLSPNLSCDGAVSQQVCRKKGKRKKRNSCLVWKQHLFTIVFRINNHLMEKSVIPRVIRCFQCKFSPLVPCLSDILKTVNDPYSGLVRVRLYF